MSRTGGATRWKSLVSDLLPTVNTPGPAHKWQVRILRDSLWRSSGWPRDLTKLKYKKLWHQMTRLVDDGKRRPKDNCCMPGWRGLRWNTSLGLAKNMSQGWEKDPGCSIVGPTVGNHWKPPNAPTGAWTNPADRHQMVVDTRGCDEEQMMKKIWVGKRSSYLRI